MISPLRKSPLKRSGKPLKRTRIKKKPRSKEERERIYGPKGYVEWIHEQPCVACGYGRSECAHVGNGGTARKSDWTQTVPLCGWRYLGTNFGTIGCHRLYDEYPSHFAEAYQLDMEAEALRTNRAWLEHSRSREAVK